MHRYVYEKDSSGSGIIRHIDSGCFIPYHSKRAAYGGFTFENEHWAFFDVWFMASNTQRKKVKEASMKAIQPTCETFNIPVCDPGHSHGVSSFDGKTSAFTLACTPNVASNSLSVREAYPALYRVLSQQYEEGNNPMLKQNNTYSAPTAIAAIETKTDLQTQREYLLGRHRQVEQSIDYGALSDKLAEAFNINHDPQPKSTKELLDGIASGKFKLDEKKSALQEIAVAKGSSYYDEDDHYVPDYNPLWAMDFGGPTPDRVGFETAKKQLRADLKAAKDTIMIGEPADGLKALQALEAWTPPAGPAN